jgi:nucleoside-diphosphate-sugar epimerase
MASARTLIIGGGVIGSQIARILVEQGQRPVLLDRAAQLDSIADAVALDKVDIVSGDVLSPLSLSSAIVAHGITAIAHTAAHPMLTAGAQKEPYAALQLNIMGTLNVLETARVHGVKRVVVSSSSVLNQAFAGGEAKGDLSREEAFPRPTTFYAMTKQAVESMGLNYARHAGIEFAGLRYGPVAGPWRGAGGGEPTNVFRGAINAAMKGEEVPLPPAALEWVYSKDAAAATVLALQAASLGSRIFNVTMGVIVTPEAFGEALRTVFPNVRLKTAKELVAGAFPAERKPADISLAKQVLGYAPKYDMAGAVRDYVEWVKEIKT